MKEGTPVKKSAQGRNRFGGIRGKACVALMAASVSFVLTGCQGNNRGPIAGYPGQMPGQMPGGYVGQMPGQYPPMQQLPPAPDKGGYFPGQIAFQPAAPVTTPAIPEQPIPGVPTQPSTGLPAQPGTAQPVFPAMPGLPGDVPQIPGALPQLPAGVPAGPVTGQYPGQ